MAKWYAFAQRGQEIILALQSFDVESDAESWDQARRNAQEQGADPDTVEFLDAESAQQRYPAVLAAYWEVFRAARDAIRAELAAEFGEDR